MQPVFQVQPSLVACHTLRAVKTDQSSLPCHNGVHAQLKKHPWFDGFDWAALAKQELEAPRPVELVKVHLHGDLLPEHLRASLVSCHRPPSSAYAK